jgi:hypothetical protein
MNVTGWDKCGHCDELIEPGAVGDAREPCPKCGSLARRISLEAQLHASATITADLTVVTYPQDLLTLAEELAQGPRPELAVVVAHIAAEIAVERSFTEAFAARNIQDLEEPTTEFFQSFNLANDRVRALYTALTGDQVAQQPFWCKFKESSTRRNRAVHGGKRCSSAEARETLAATRALVTHLAK